MEVNARDSLSPDKADFEGAPHDISSPVIPSPISPCRLLVSNTIVGSEEIARALSQDQSTERGKSGNRKILIFHC